MSARRIALWLGGGILALLLLCALAVAGLNTGWGHGILLRQVAAYKTTSGLNLRAARLDGSLYGRMTFYGMEVRDLKGIVATAPALTIEWQPLAYLHKTIAVREVNAVELRLLRSAVLKASDPNSPLLPDINLTLGRLAVTRLIVEPAVSGRLAVARVSASATIVAGRLEITADAASLRLLGAVGGDRMALHIKAVPQANHLFIDVHLDAPARGLVDSYTKLGKPLSLVVAGRGDWAHWQGSLHGTAGDAPLATVALNGTRGVFTARGRLLPETLLAIGPARSLVMGGVTIDGTAQLVERRVDVHARLKAAAFVVAAHGRIDLATNRYSSLQLAAQLLRPGVITANLAGRDVRLAATLDGPFMAPILDYKLSAENLAFNAMGIDGLVASGRARIDANRILVPLSARALRVRGLNAAAGGLLTNLAINGDLIWSHDQLLSDNLKLRSDRIDATAVIAADIAHGRYTGALKGRINRYEIGGFGLIDLTTDAHLVSGPHGTYGIAGSVKGVARRIDNTSLREQLGGNAQLTAEFNYDATGVVSVQGLRLVAPRLRITSGSGRYSPDGRINFQAAGASNTYGPLAVAATGTLARPSVQLRAERPGLGIALNHLVADLIKSPAGYRIHATGGSTYGPLAADVVVRAGKGSLTLDIPHASVAAIMLHGAVTQTAAGPFAGTVVLNGSGLQGSVLLAASGHNQQADIDLSAHAARLHGPTAVTIGTGHLRARAVLTPNAPSIIGTALLTDLRAGALLVTQAQSRFDYHAGLGSAALVAKGSSASPFAIATQAQFTPVRIVANASGSFNTIPFHLAAPAIATKTGNLWQLAPVTLIVPQGKAQLAGHYGRDIAVQVQLDNLDFGIVQAFKPGLGLGGGISGTINAAMASGAALPIVDARLSIAHFTRTAAYTISAPVDIATRMQVSAAGASTSAVIRRSGVKVGHFTAELTHLADKGTLTERLYVAPLAGGIRYNGPAEVLWALAGTAGQQLSGPISVAADFSGQLDRPILNGVIRASNLRYENQAYGTIISNLALQGRFTQANFELQSLTGRAGKGSVNAHGTFGLDSANGYPLNLALDFDKAQLAHSDALGATASGTLTITKSMGAGLIRGTLTVPDARYQVIRQGAAEVTELAGVQRKTSSTAIVASPEPKASRFRLDLRVRAANSIFISGMGLEAEWQTDMHITGTATQPVVIGKLEVVRGTYSFAGRRFDLAQDGAITFDGGRFNNPQLTLSANTTVEDITATINISGRAERPQIDFTSTPVLPQDEVLARLLFGGSVTSLSPTQAIQLAASLNSLRNSGSSFNPLGKLRSAIGIDRLRVLSADKTTGQGTSLAAGKYISKNVYVEVITDARGFTATQLQIGLTRALSLLSSTSSFGGSNASLKYSKNY